VLWLSVAHPIALLCVVAMAALVMGAITVMLIRFLRAFLGRLTRRRAIASRSPPRSS
jgi:hypothetical protein